MSGIAAVFDEGWWYTLWQVAAPHLLRNSVMQYQRLRGKLALSLFR